MPYLGCEPVRDGIDKGVEVEGRQVGVLCLDEHDVRPVVPGQVNLWMEWGYNNKRNDKLSIEMSGVRLLGE